MSVQLPRISSSEDPVTRAEISTERQNPAHELRLKQRHHQRQRKKKKRKNEINLSWTSVQKLSTAHESVTYALRVFGGQTSPPRPAGRHVTGFAALALLLLQHRTDYFLTRLCDSSPTSTQRTRSSIFGHKDRPVLYVKELDRC